MRLNVRNIFIYHMLNPPYLHFIYQNSFIFICLFILEHVAVTGSAMQKNRN